MRPVPLKTRRTAPPKITSTFVQNTKPTQIVTPVKEPTTNFRVPKRPRRQLNVPLLKIQAT